MEAEQHHLPPAKVPKLTRSSEEEQERVMGMLEERLEIHDDNRRTVQSKIKSACDNLKEQINELEDKITKELEEKYFFEDARLQAALNDLRVNNNAIDALQKAKAELLMMQSYEIIECKEHKPDLNSLYELKTERRFVPELMEMGKPTNVRVTNVDAGNISVRFTCLNPEEERVLTEYDFMNWVEYKCVASKKDNEREGREYLLHKDDEGSSSLIFTPDNLEAETPYEVRVKMMVGDKESEWSDTAELITPGFKECCVWKECPDGVDEEFKYSVDEKNPRVATKINSNGWCTIIGNTPIPLSKVTSWNIKILKSENNGNGICIGVAPSDINQNDEDNSNKCGWYFHCYDSKLWSGPPHNYRGKTYGPRKEKGQYVHTGDSVGVVIDTTNEELSFALNGVDRGVAYEGIPLDKPLVPCVLLFCQGDSVEFII